MSTTNLKTNKLTQCKWLYAIYISQIIEQVVPAKHSETEFLLKTDEIQHDQHRMSKGHTNKLSVEQSCRKREIDGDKRD